MIIAAVLKAGLSCPECKLAVPVNAIAASTRCNHCGSRLTLSWKRLLDLGNPKINALDRAISLSPGESDKGAFGSIFLDVTRTEPECRACQAALPLEPLLAAAAEGKTSAPCAACQAEVPLRAAPRELLTAYPAARALLYEAAVSDEFGGSADEQHAPLLFPCMACGAPLSIDGATRTVTCQYCKAESYLPDGVWLRLHPPRKREPFVVLSDVDDVTLFVQHYRFAKNATATATRDAARTDLPEAQLIALARFGSREVGALVAANPTSTPEVLLALAGTAYRQVRDAVASNPRVTPAVLTAIAEKMEGRVLGRHGEDDFDARGDFESIAGDPRATLATLEALAKSDRFQVREGVAGNPACPPRAVLLLQKDPEERVRRALAGRPGTPAEVLMGLARDPESSVLEALAGNPTAPAEVLAVVAKTSDREAVHEALKKNPSYKRRWWALF